MSPIITSAAPIIPPDRFTAICLNGVWRVIETVSGKSFIICDAANPVAAQFLAQAANEKYARAIQDAVQKLNQEKSKNFKRAYAYMLTQPTRSLN